MLERDQLRMKTLQLEKRMSVQELATFKSYYYWREALTEAPHQLWPVCVTDAIGQKLHFLYGQVKGHYEVMRAP